MAAAKTSSTRRSKYSIAIVGSGPAGLSAAIRAADTGVSHVLIEAKSHIANTAYQYHMGKHITAEPKKVPLYESLTFKEGKREDVLFNWQKEVISRKVSLELNTEITKITGKRGAFNLTTHDGRKIKAETVVLATGNQGNVNRLDIDDERNIIIQYGMTDPKKYIGERIIIVGAGDSGIENALAIYKKNTVTLINDDYDFSLALPDNADVINRVIQEERIEHITGATITGVASGGPEDKKNKLIVETANGSAEIPFDRIIARLGAATPWDFLQACGIKQANNRAAEFPDVTENYESQRRGIYIIGDLVGARQIRQCINHGYEVVEQIRGKTIKYADEELLRKKFKFAPGRLDAGNVMTASQARIPLLAGMNKVQLRDFFLESEFKVMSTNDYIFHKNEYSDAFYSIYSGEVFVEDDDKAGLDIFTLKEGQFFGEMSLISGRRRSATVRAGKNCMLIETTRHHMKKLISENSSVKRQIDQSFIEKTLQTRFASTATVSDIAKVADKATLRHYSPGEVIFSEGDEADCIHVIRGGSVTVSKFIGGHEVVLSYLPAGHYIGEMGIMGQSRRTTTVRAVSGADMIELSAKEFNYLLDKDNELKSRVQQEYKRRLTKNMANEQQGGNSIISFLVSRGAGKASDVLLIDESLCVNCSNCEKACADIHVGTSRLDVGTGPLYASIRIPTSCRHCEHPYCMKDCPPDAISRAEDGEIIIADNCIGCGNCYESCPYGVIQMEESAGSKNNLWAWLLFGVGSEPGNSTQAKKRQKDTGGKAVKCDMCQNFATGPACVRACPTGAVLRIKPDELSQYAGKA